MEPGLQRVQPGDRQLPEAQAVDARMVRAVAAGRSLELGRRERQASPLGRAERALESGRSPPVVHGGAEPLELVGRGPVKTRGDEEPVERELEVEAARRAVADRDTELFLQRRPGMEA